MYSIVIRTISAPKSGGGQYRRPVRVLVVSQVKGRYAYSDDPDVVAEWYNVDSRYAGDRSAYGSALRQAREMVDTLNRAERYAQAIAAV